MENLIGKKYNRLTVVSFVGRSGKSQYLWKCVCDCGNIKIASRSNLTSGDVKSCGCLNRELSSQRLTKHNMADTQIYTTWCGIKSRCYNINNSEYKYYGGRGISMSPEWINDFSAFYMYVSKLEHYGEKGYSIDRINVNGNYEPNNVRWANKKTQANNTTVNRWITYNGETHTLSEWSEIVNLSQTTISARIRNNWSVEDALTKPLQKQFSHKKR